MKEGVLSKTEQNLGSAGEAGETFPGSAARAKARLVQRSLAGWPFLQRRALWTPSASVYAVGNQ